MHQFPDHYLVFENLDEALREYGMPVENVVAVRDVMAPLKVAAFYIISDSPTYIGVVGHGTGPNLGYINKGSIDLRGADRAWTRHWLPVAPGGGRSGGGRTGKPDSVPEICPECSYALPVSGVCGNCD
jgi:hypothetical protein